ncbi:hypothetical protein AALP_AA3G210700 [Arabis alpina]|uniref:Uncharacterized protein n=1 Tax=Arabis alpina TaxID=50452 RepID=A0A087HAM9_ARAAL|nr:hypothetical protein AALP_AA3G210700 [Arabis alpina]
MSSESSTSVKLDRKRIHRDPDITLAHASDYRSDRVETDECTSGGERGSLINFRTAAPISPGPGLGHGIKLDDCNDVASSMRSSMVYTLTPVGGWDGIAIRYPGALQKDLLMAVVVLAAERGGVVNLDEFEEISSFSPIGNTGHFYISPRGGYQLVAGHSSQAQEALGSGDRVEKVARFNTTGLPVEVDHLYAGAVFRVGIAERLSSSPRDFVFDFRGGGKHISQVPSACLQFVRCVRGGPDFLSPPRDDSSLSDPDMRFAMSAISMLAGYNFLSDVWYASDQKNRKLNVQNGELVTESNRSLEARREAELEVELESKVTALTLALAEAEEVKKNEVSQIEGEVAELKSSSKDAVARAVEEAKKRAKDKICRSLEVMEERSRAQTEVDRLASLASQVVGPIRRMDKAAKEGAPIDAAKKEKLEARFAAYTAEADQIVLPSLHVDSSDDEEAEPRWNVALNISLSDSSDEEAERTEVYGRMSVAGKIPALTRAEIEEVTSGEAQDRMDQLELELFEGEAEGNAELAGAEELATTKEPVAAEESAATDVVDAATVEPIAPLFPDSNHEEQEAAPRSLVIDRVFLFRAATFMHDGGLSPAMRSWARLTYTFEKAAYVPEIGSSHS